MHSALESPDLLLSYSMITLALHNTIILTDTDKSFTDQHSMKNSVEGDEMEMLQKYGPDLNTILTGRAGKAVDTEKTKGVDFITSYLLKETKVSV